MGYKEVWFITGASTGFGLHLTKGLLRNGHRVAAVMQEKKFPAGRDIIRTMNAGSDAEDSQPADWVTQAGEEAGNSGLSDWAERAGQDPETSKDRETSGNTTASGNTAASGNTGTSSSTGTGWLEGDLLCLTADLTNEDSVQAAVQQTIRQFGRIDNVVNYAGYDLPGPITTLSERLIHQYFEENVFGSFYVLRQVMPYLQAQRSGTILNFSSAAAVAAGTSSMIYMAGKLAIRSLSEQLTAGIESMGIQQTFIGPAATLQREDESLLQNNREGIFSKKDNAGGYREQPFQKAALI